MKKEGMHIKVETGVNNEVKLACLEFGKWLRTIFDFPIFVKVYIKCNHTITTINRTQASATFWAPLCKNKEPYVKVATGDYDDIVSQNGKYNALMSILCSFAHEIIHYQQWCAGRQMTEKEAKKESVKLVEDFSSEKKGLITASKKVLHLITRADNFYIQKKFEKALEYYKKALGVNSQIDLTYSMGKTFEAMLCFREAIQCYDKAIELYPDDEDFYICKGYCLDMLAEYNDAIACYDKAIKINSKKDIAYHNKGYSLIYLKRFKEAIHCFNKSVKLNPQSFESYVYMGQSYGYLNNYMKAIKCFNEAIMINPKYELAYNDRGRILFFQKKYKEAIQNYDKAIKINSKYAEPYYNKAILYIVLNKVRKSIVSLGKAIELDAVYKEYAQGENHFKVIKDTDKFKALIAETSGAVENLSE